MTQSLGTDFARKLAPGAVIALEGELGSGKTCFVQGMARALGVSERTFVRSPSFTILNQYDGDLTIYHLDFYRLNALEDLEDLGLDELFDGDGITVIEWADKFAEAMPRRTIHIGFSTISDTVRNIDIPALP